MKGLVFGLLEDAAARGDRVSLVAFRSACPRRPSRCATGSLARAGECLRDIPLSGRTPLAEALDLAGRLLRQELRKRRNARPLLVCVSDGLPNVPLHGGRSARRRPGRGSASASRRHRLRHRRRDSARSGSGAADPHSRLCGRGHLRIVDCRRQHSWISSRGSRRARAARGSRALEAFLDPLWTLCAGPGCAPAFVEALEASELLSDSLQEDLWRSGRRSEDRSCWGAHTATQGEVLASFAAHCAEDPTDIDVVAGGPRLSRYAGATRRAGSSFATAFSARSARRRAATMLIAEIRPRQALIDVFLTSGAARSWRSVTSLSAHRHRPFQRVRLLRVVPEGRVRRQAAAGAAYTKGLIDRGFLSLGMG